MILGVRAVAPFYKNGFVVGCERTREAVVIDPGDEVDQLLGAVHELDVEVKHILLTHAHLDHITGVAAAKDAWNAPVYLHRDDLFLYEAVQNQGAMFGMRVSPQPPPDVFYDGSIITFGDYEVLMNAITTVLLPLGDECVVHPGHGPDTTIGRERTTNQFVVAYLES